MPTMTDETVKLTPRQAQVLKRLLHGESPRQIAGAMQLSIHTVREYVKAVYRAHGVTSRQLLMAGYIRSHAQNDFNSAPGSAPAPAPAPAPGTAPAPGSVDIVGVQTAVDA